MVSHNREVRYKVRKSTNRKNSAHKNTVDKQRKLNKHDKKKRRHV